MALPQGTNLGRVYGGSYAAGRGSSRPASRHTAGSLTHLRISPATANKDAQSDPLHICLHHGPVVVHAAGRARQTTAGRRGRLAVKAVDCERTLWLPGQSGTECCIRASLAPAEEPPLRGPTARLTPAAGSC